MSLDYNEARKQVIAEVGEMPGNISVREAFLRLQGKSPDVARAIAEAEAKQCIDRQRIMRLEARLFAVQALQMYREVDPENPTFSESAEYVRGYDRAIEQAREAAIG